MGSTINVANTAGPSTATLTFSDGVIGPVPPSGMLALTVGNGGNHGLFVYAGGTLNVNILRILNGATWRLEEDLVFTGMVESSNGIIEVGTTVVPKSLTLGIGTHLGPITSGSDSVRVGPSS